MFRMMKKYFTDGLIQVAIVLSLLRTDLNNYMNSLGDYANPDIETILGTSIAYTQTHFHRHRIESHSYGYAHLKGADSIYTRHFEDLFSLARHRRPFVGVGRDVDAWLVSQPQPVELASEGAIGNPSSTGTEFSASEESGQRIVTGASVVEPTLPLDGGNDTLGDSIDTEPENASAMVHNEISTAAIGDDLTKEDMDLIDVLWRQDIDLGAGRDVFDVSLRKELEQERELELIKERGSQQEADNVQLKDEKQQLSVTYILDNETGELVPVPCENVELQGNTHSVLPPSYTDPQPAADPSVLFTEDQQFSVEDTLSLFDDPVAPSTVPNDSMSMDFAFDNLIADVTQQQMVTPPVGGIQQQQSQQPQQQYENMSLARQSSFEQRWQDVASILLNDSLQTDVATDVDARPVALLQNVTMTDANFSENDLSSAFDFPSSFDLTPASINLITNSSMDALDALPSPTFLNMDTNDFVFANTTNESPSVWPGGATGGGVENNSSNVLFQNLVNSTLLDQLNMDNLTTAISPASVPLMKMLEDTSSDSAISSYGDASSASDFFDSQFSDSSPYDGLVGAIGGDSETKPPKNEPPLYNSATDDDESTMNHTTTTNTTSGDPYRIAHNHTYTTQPGETPRQVKCYAGKARKQRKSHTTRGIEMSVDELVDCPVERFTALLSSRKLTKEQTQLARDIRRRGKNKVAAQNCRQRKMRVVDELADEVDKLRALKRELVAERASVRDEVATAEARLSRLHDSTMRALRDAHGRPYDPASYSLQQAANGDVFVVPCSGSTLAPPRNRGGDDNAKKSVSHRRKN